MFLGYKVITKGIKVCPNKVEAVLSLPSLKCLKDVQKLNGKLASRKRFMSKLAETSLSFLKTLKKYTKKSDFQWTAEAEAAFKQMKKLIAELPTLTIPLEKEELIVYLAAAREATLFTDGSSCVDGFGAGLILTSPEGTKFTYALRFRFDATNNEAEDEALIVGLRIAEQMSVKILQTNVDSRLVANQVNESYVAKKPGMMQYLEKVKALSSNFKKFSIKQVPRSEKKKSDALRKIAPTSFAHLTKQVLVEELNEKSINEAEVLAVVEEEGDTWMTPIYEYLTEETLPSEKEKARAIRCKSRWFGLLGEIISDNKKQFRDNPFIDTFASIKHPQANGLVERANKSLGEGIKARLDERSKDWIEEIPHVLWAHKTKIKSSDGDTPFSLTYRTEAVIPTKIGMPTLRTAEIDIVQNDEALEINLDLLEEIREQAAIREARSKTKM
ncbi:reverse transcriptase domain-containing protein [Tanacetum coccineum]|uniref:Reverse transcriptase domain-containing protein n=1 Tax=Tanacetum coccineum TaxID=301880 RepID=A0ABQ5G058_9ASTR